VSFSGLRERFRDLHREGTFLMPNAFDVGSARVLESLGFSAIATTSGGFAAALGRMDQDVSRDEVVQHVRSITEAVAVPLSVDAENCYSESDDGIRETVDRLAEAGAAGFSIEDYSPESGIYPFEVALSRVAVAVEAAKHHELVVTARAENYLYDIDDIEDTIRRLVAFREAGADAVYAPRLTDADKFRRIVEETGAPVNGLLVPTGPTVPEFAELGVRRISVGAAFTYAAYGALAAAAREFLDTGTTSFVSGALSMDDRLRAFGKG
jgi:2-methylisocitrate lyase-like PEP mutase family enzyme